MGGTIGTKLDEIFTLPNSKHWSTLEYKDYSTRHTKVSTTGGVTSEIGSASGETCWSWCASGCSIPLSRCPSLKGSHVNSPFHNAGPRLPRKLFWNLPRLGELSSDTMKRSVVGQVRRRQAMCNWQISFSFLWLLPLNEIKHHVLRCYGVASCWGVPGIMRKGRRKWRNVEIYGKHGHVMGGRRGDGESRGQKRGALRTEWLIGVDLSIFMCVAASWQTVTR